MSDETAIAVDAFRNEVVALRVFDTEKVLHLRRNEIVVRTDPENSKSLRARFVK